MINSQEMHISAHLLRATAAALFLSACLPAVAGPLPQVEQWQAEVAEQEAARIKGLIKSLSGPIPSDLPKQRQPAVYPVKIDPVLVALANAAPDSIPFLLASLTSRQKVRPIFHGAKKRTSLGFAARYLIGQLFTAYFKPPPGKPPAPLRSWQPNRGWTLMAYVRWWGAVRLATLIHSPGTDIYQVDPLWLRATLADPDRLQRLVRIVPAFHKAQPIGFKLLKIKAGSLISRGGLQNGDVVQSVNSISLIQPGLHPYCPAECKEYKIQLLRKSKKKTLRYLLREFPWERRVRLPEAP